MKNMTHTESYFTFTENDSKILPYILGLWVVNVLGVFGINYWKRVTKRNTKEVEI